MNRLLPCITFVNTYDVKVAKFCIFDHVDL